MSSPRPPTPTLTAAEREATVLEFLAHPTCDLPCWWNAIPAQSTWAEVESGLAQIGANTGSEQLAGGQTYHGAGGLDVERQFIYNRVGWLEEAGVIERIEVRSEGWANLAGWQEAWANYAPERIIRQYGTPARVWLSSIGISYGSPSVGYDLWLFYDQLGFVIGYGGSVEFGPTYQFCPRFEQGERIGSLRMTFQSPDNALPLENSLHPEKLAWPGLLTIEAAAGITVEQFAALFTQADPPACFDTPREAWPSP